LAGLLATSICSDNKGGCESIKWGTVIWSFFRNALVKQQQPWDNSAKKVHKKTNNIFLMEVQNKTQQQHLTAEWLQV
jgi:hypothetical protein